MKTVLIFIFFCCCNLFCFAQKNVAVDKLVKEGIALHDKGDYEGAIKLYDDALLIDKEDYDANYEKSLSCQYAKRYDECIAICKYLLEKHADNADIKDVYSNYGSVLDDKGETDAAIKIFDAGIKKFPKFYLLYFNRGLTQSRQKKWEEATESFMQALQNKPAHAGSLYYMALIQEKSNKIVAVMSCLAFLAVEPEGKRAEVMYKYMNDLIKSFATKGDNGSTLITTTAGDLDKKKTDNNFSSVELVMGLTIASSLADTVKNNDKAAQLSMLIKMMDNALSVEQKEGKGLYWTVYAPFFTDMDRAELVPVFAHIAAITSGDPQNIQWLNDHQDKMAAFNKWLANYKWKSQ